MRFIYFNVDFIIFAVDLIRGLALAFTIFATAVFAIALCIAMLLNWDPIYLLKHILVNTIFLPYVSSIWFERFLIIFQLFRYGISFLVANWFIVNVRTMIIVVLTTATSFVSLEGILIKNDQKRLSNSTISLYKQLTIERNTLLSCEKAQIAGFLTAVFFIIIFSISAVEIGILFESPIISISGGGLALIVVAVLVVTLNLACLIYERSIKIRSLWKWKIYQQSNVKYFRRVLKCLKPLIVPAGNMGKVDKEMKMNYSHAVLVNTVNLLVGLSQFIKVR